MVKVREKCYTMECDGKPDIFPLYFRGYDNKFKRATKEHINENKGKKEVRYGFICPICKAITWRDKKNREFNRTIRN